LGHPQAFVQRAVAVRVPVGLGQGTHFCMGRGMQKEKSDFQVRIVLLCEPLVQSPSTPEAAS
jgi:hypothetical protein